jgi:hypothetical protein
VIASATVDFAILDVNLSGKSSYPVAELLIACRIPFVFETGYDHSGLPPTCEQTPVLQKPFRAHDLDRAMGAVLTDRQARA